MCHFPKWLISYRFRPATTENSLVFRALQAQFSGQSIVGSFHLRPLFSLLLIFLLSTHVTPVRAEKGDSQFKVASSHFAAKRWKIAAEEFSEFLKRWPQHRRVTYARFYLGEARIQLQQFELARNVLRKAAESGPNFQFHARVLFRIGQTSWKLNDNRIASDELQQFVAQFPEHDLCALALPYLGDTHLSLGEAELGKNAFQKSLKRFPKGPRAAQSSYGLARAWEQLGKLEATLPLYRALSELPNSKLADDAHLNLGARLFDLKRFEEAAQTFRELSEKHPSSRLIKSALLNEGWCHYQNQHFPKAISCFEALEQHPRLGSNAQFWHGLSLKALHHWDQAYKKLIAVSRQTESDLSETEAINDQNPESRGLQTRDLIRPQALFHAADSLLQNGKPAEASVRFLQLTRDWPESILITDSFLNAARAEFNLGNHKEVFRITQLITVQFPQSAQAKEGQLLQGRSAILQKDYTAAVEVLNRIVSTTVETAQEVEICYYLGLAYQQKQNHQQAIRTWKPLLLMSPDQALLLQSHYVNAISHFALEQYVVAIEQLQHFISLMDTASSSSENRRLLGQAIAHLSLSEVRIGQYSKSNQHWSMLTQEFSKLPVTIEVSRQIAESLYFGNQYAQAGQVYQWLLNNEPDNSVQAQALSGLGWSQFQLQQYSQAASTLDLLLDRFPDHASAAESALLRGRVLEADNQLEDAMTAYQYVQTHFPRHTESPLALWQQARIHIQLGKRDTAIEQYRQLAEQPIEFTEQDHALYEWAWVHLDADQDQQASQVFRLLLEKHPDSELSGDALINIAESHYRERDYASCKKTLQTLQSAINNQESGEQKTRLQHAIWYRNGRLAVDQKQWDQCRVPFTNLIESATDTSMVHEARFWIAETDYQTGNYRTSEEAFNHLIEEVRNRNTSWINTARLRTCQAIAAQERWKEAIHSAHTLLQTFPGYPLEHEVDYLIGRCHSSQAEFDLAREAFDRCLESASGKNTETAAQAQFMIGETYFHQKDFEQALRAFLRVEILYAYPQWQAASLFEAGKCAERMNMPQQAITFYQKILDTEKFRETSFAEKAMTRLQTLPNSSQTTKP